MTGEIPIAEVRIGNRFRRDMGDTDALAASMLRVGLLQPIVLTPDQMLVAGRRRLEAARKLGWSSIAAVTVTTLGDALRRLQAERDENTERKGFAPSEAVALAEALEPLEREAARARQSSLNGRTPAPENFTEADRGNASDKIAGAVGMSRPTLTKAREVCRAAEERPELAPLVEQMDRTGKVDGAYRDLQKVRKQDERKEAAELGRRDFGDRLRLIHCAVADLAAEVEAGSLDCIITDPPYPREYLPVYSDLSQFAAHALKPGGVLLAMVGQSYLPEVYTRLGEALEYQWTLAYLTPGGQSAQVFPRKINPFWKPVLVYVNGAYSGPWHGDVIRSDVNDNDKSHHHWGQSESGIARLVEEWTKPGELVCDPFLGGGTTAEVALRLGRCVIGADSEAEPIAATRQRLEGAQW